MKTTKLGILCLYEVTSSCLILYHLADRDEEKAFYMQLPWTCIPHMNRLVAVDIASRILVLSNSNVSFAELALLRSISGSHPDNYFMERN